MLKTFIGDGLQKIDVLDPNLVQSISILLLRINPHYKILKNKLFCIIKRPTFCEDAYIGLSGVEHKQIKIYDPNLVPLIFISDYYYERSFIMK